VEAAVVEVAEHPQCGAITRPWQGTPSLFLVHRRERAGESAEHRASARAHRDQKRSSPAVGTPRR